VRVLSASGVAHRNLHCLLSGRDDRFLDRPYCTGISQNMTQTGRICLSLSRVADKSTRYLPPLRAGIVRKDRTPGETKQWTGTTVIANNVANIKICIGYAQRRSPLCRKLCANWSRSRPRGTWGLPRRNGGLRSRF